MSGFNLTLVPVSVGAVGVTPSAFRGTTSASLSQLTTPGFIKQGTDGCFFKDNDFVDIVTDNTSGVPKNHRIYAVILSNGRLSFTAQNENFPAGSDGQIVQFESAAVDGIVPASLDAGTGISINNVSGAITISSTVSPSSPVTPANGGTGVSNPTAHTLPVAEGSSNFNFLGPLTNGQLLVGSTGADPVPAAITAGAGINVTNGAGSITITNTLAGAVWHDSTVGAIIVPENAYSVDNAGSVTFTLPTTAAYGSIFEIAQRGGGTFSLAQNAGQSIVFNSSTSTVGVTGSVVSLAPNATIKVLTVVDDTTFQVLSSSGSFSVL